MVTSQYEAFQLCVHTTDFTKRPDCRFAFNRFYFSTYYIIFGAVAVQVIVGMIVVVGVVFLMNTKTIVVALVITDLLDDEKMW